MILRFFTVVFMSSCFLQADELSLTGSARLSGTVRSIGENGAVELVTPLSPETIFLKGGAVANVAFTAPETPVVDASSLIFLSNGDTFPGVVQSLDGSWLTVKSDGMGTLRIPSTALRSLQLGMGNNRMIYPGFKSLEGWEQEDGADEWELDKQVLEMHSVGRISRKFILPESFRIHFDLEWDHAPAIQLLWVDPLSGEDADGYVFRWDASGIELNRVFSNGDKPVTLAFLNCPPDRYPGKKATVDLRVDSARGVITLYLDGEREGSYMDVTGSLPRCSEMTMECIVVDETVQRIKNFQVSEWSPGTDRYRTGERGPKKRAALISRHGERWNGELLAVREEKGTPWFIFKSDSMNDLVELPESEISTIFFAETQELETAIPVSPFILQLRGAGALSVSSCLFDETNARVVHPVLGHLVIPRLKIASLEWNGKSKPGGTP